MIVLFISIIQILIYAIILRAILSWVFAAGIRNSLLFSIDRFLGSVTSPIMKPLHRYLPRTGGVDFSPMIAVILLALFSRILLAILT
jgi:YggT family protein